MTALSFFLAWLANPLRVGAVSPSSPALADTITAEITPACAPIIELGPGTGVFTRSLLARGIPEDRLALIEYSADFARNLQRRFPCAQVLHMDATRLNDIELFDGERAGAVVSGLPLLLMPPKKVIAILAGAFEHLRADGAFYQFTYGPESPVSRAILDRLGLKATRVGRALANVPPATVYRIRRRQPRPAANRLAAVHALTPAEPARLSNERRRQARSDEALHTPDR
jgi:phosphatidylethanolamine/phosphatidyl-N-methylethanolamine N-methyltransferase